MMAAASQAQVKERRMNKTPIENLEARPETGITQVALALPTL
jgi:uncharacterized protein YlzI (FlbEa/FlbD family)